jgi:hypothetical protein
MRAELANKRGDRIYVSDNGTFDRYITDGWSVISIVTTEGKEDEQRQKEKPHEARKRGRPKVLK